MLKSCWLSRRLLQENGLMLSRFIFWQFSIHPAKRFQIDEKTKDKLVIKKEVKKGFFGDFATTKFLGKPNKNE